MSFKAMQPAERSEACLKCHEEDPCAAGARYRFSKHAHCGVSCTDCHTSHYNVPAGTPPTTEPGTGALDLPGQSLRRLLATLLMAELNVDYVYPIVGRSESGPVLALHVQELEAAAHALKDHGFKLLDQDSLG